MFSNRPYNAIVVGARAAGAATAMLLARQGLRVLALERTEYGSDTLSTHALMRAGVLQLHRWGLLDRVRQSGAPPVRQVAFHYPDETVRVALRSTGGIDGLYAPRRTVLDRILADAAREAGADVRFGVVVNHLLRTDDGRVVGVTARDEAGRPFEARADIVIGADGIKSLVARAVGAETQRTAAGNGATVYAYFDNVEASGYEWVYSPGRAAGVIPTNDGQVCVFVSGVEPYFREHVFRDLDRGFHHVLEEISPNLAERIADGRRAASYRGFAGVYGYVRRPWGRGWALVGDAGYFKDPITAHGISDALRDAETLTRAVVGELSMAEYETLRNAVSRDLFDVTEKVATFAWTMEEIKVYLRQVSDAMKAEIALIEERPMLVKAAA
jgi:flavin-dependent dehydrogenase